MGGKVELAVVTSPCDNVIHSLVNTSSYTGSFLPGFNKTESDELDKEERELLCDIDHVTYVCHEGESLKILAFYKETCGMERFLVSPMEEVDRGVEIGDEVGLRLMAGQWLSEWLCREEGLQWPAEELEEPAEDGPCNDNGNHLSENNQLWDDTLPDTSSIPMANKRTLNYSINNPSNCESTPSNLKSSKVNFKLVLAEPLPDSPWSHVNTFLEAHGGPGLQHIGLSTLTMAPTVARLSERGAVFRKPPPTYYDIQGKREQIMAIKEDPGVFKELGILIDPEVGEGRIGDCLLQIFSTPLFAQNTFFLEVIQRRGLCRGFGAGNILALALSIVMMQRESNLKEEEDS